MGEREAHCEEDGEQANENAYGENEHFLEFGDSSGERFQAYPVNEGDDAEYYEFERQDRADPLKQCKWTHLSGFKDGSVLPCH